ncbi:hypothetical protein COC42_00525 [Sphingomonas spermidinifaciens]|uniref:Uncharacterized protein n=1 Tax=Sphingomonas spermidinifaciens TaxID=1141889 RepID=A0A2A4B4G1_9SPHN|nr:hypothetical protein COC42_00525 [Sphingomonas spermidinifaciens]
MQSAWLLAMVCVDISLCGFALSVQAGRMRPFLRGARTAIGIVRVSGVVSFCWAMASSMGQASGRWRSGLPVKFALDLIEGGDECDQSGRMGLGS